MKISYFFPNTLNRSWPTEFCKYSDHTFLFNDCDSDCDIIFCGSITVLKHAIQARHKYKKRLICWVWDIPYNWREWCYTDKDILSNQNRDKNIKKQIDLLEQCEEVISGSKYTQKILQDRFGIRSHQMYFYYSKPKMKQVEQKKQIIQIGRFWHNKRFDITISATKELPYDLICCGGLSKTQYYDKIRDMEHPSCKFYINENRESMIEKLQSSMLLVSPSIHEGWGLTPIEAIHCNIPILLSDIEVFREVYGDNAVYHQKDNVEDMQDKISLLMEDSDLRKVTVLNCKPMIIEYTPEKFSERFVKYLKKI